MTKQAIASLLGVSVFLSVPVVQAQQGNLGWAVNYGVFTGATLELTYPITSTLQVRGALSSGMDYSDTLSDTQQSIEYNVTSSGTMNRLALDFHPFETGFFLSAGYAVSDFSMQASGGELGTVEIGDVLFDGAVSVNSEFTWSSAPTLSMGWGHSPSKGFGFLVEAGAYLTGTPSIDMTGSCSSSLPGGCQGFEAELAFEEEELKQEVANEDVLPLFQVGVSYRF